MPVGRSEVHRRKRHSRQCRGGGAQRHRDRRWLGTFAGLVAGARRHEKDFSAMDFLKSIFRSEAASTPMALPSGTFTIDRTGRIVTSTLSNNFPEKLALEIGRAVIDTFRKAQAAEVVLTELTVN